MVFAPVRAAGTNVMACVSCIEHESKYLHYVIGSFIFSVKCAISSSEAPSVDPRCLLSLHQGTCREYRIQWYYDKQANSCAQFWYGGCGGNDNRFETDEECKKTCVLNRRGK